MKFVKVIRNVCLNLKKKRGWGVGGWRGEGTSLTFYIICQTQLCAEDTLGNETVFLCLQSLECMGNKH